MIAGSLTETMVYTGSSSKQAVEDELELQVQTFIRNDVDFVIAEVNIKYVIMYTDIQKITFKLV